MKYDDASWHYGGDFPANLPNEAGATHIGMFVAWCVLNGMAGKIHLEDFADELEKLNNRDITPGEWFIKYCDEKFMDEDLDEQGNRFTMYYYVSKDAPYLAVYSEVLGGDSETLYEVPDSWESYDLIADKIAQAFDEWKTDSQ